MKNSNKGYSLVELIIVIAMIAILSGISLVSITLINTARAKQASTTLGDEVNAVRKRNMTMMPVEEYAVGGVKKTRSYYEYTDPISGEKMELPYSYGLVLYYANNKFQIAQVECKQMPPSGGSTFYKYKDYDGLNPVKVDNVALSSRIDIKYNGYFKSFQNGDDNGGNPRSDFKAGGIDNYGTGAISIMFDKRGNCISGYGTYEFYKKNANKVATVTIRQNGSIEIK
jgi:prepilin-type N-terminal cleavage/methylation domain-containing protein